VYHLRLSALSLSLNSTSAQRPFLSLPGGSLPLQHFHLSCPGTILLAHPLLSTPVGCRTERPLIAWNVIALSDNELFALCNKCLILPTNLPRHASSIPLNRLLS
jgi:hypothetical protein